MITEDYVSFETAKLLKEKGFNDEYTNSFYDKNGNLYFIDILSDFSEHPDNDTDITASTLYIAMKWLRKVYDLYIMLNFERPNCIEYKIYKYESELAKGDLLHYNYEESYEEACEEGIKYCLENLI